MKCLPGTTIEINERLRNMNDAAQNILDNIFATGGLMLSQVSALSGLENHTIQNWVKRGFLSSPIKKQYSKRQFCRIILINLLKETIQIDQVLKLLSYVNGNLADESDDLIDDSALYNYYVNMINGIEKNENPQNAVDNVLKDYTEPIPGGKKRLSKVLLIMYYAGMSSYYRRCGEKILYELN
ncbi:DUF1836 domain-containing protein [Eubacteriales bacterium OttesenSCG-928-G02]|nr:DUF1836 domain-containing protein [Eubacteriales bacterium OttesenSCG-928-G02]